MFALYSFLDLQFGSDIYLVTDGEPAPLLHSPSSFHKLVAPLPSSVDKVRFQWNSFVRDEHQVLKIIQEDCLFTLCYFIEI